MPYVPKWEQQEREKERGEENTKMNVKGIGLEDVVRIRLK
jgi:hypothetical protein